MTIKDSPGITIQEFERILAADSDRLLELVNGEISEKMPTEEHGEIVTSILTEIKLYLRQHKIGRVSTEARHRLPDTEDHDVLPDVSFIAGERPSVTEGGIPRMPDLAVEVKSPNDKTNKIQKKVDYYLQNGTRLVWVVYPQTKQVEQLRREAENTIQRQTFTLEDTLEGYDVLPGFSLPVKVIFDF